jgi:putative transposase
MDAMSQSQNDEYLFVSLYTWHREPLLRVPETKRLLLDKLADTKKQFQLIIAAYVVLDDHLHLLFTTPPGNECSAIVNHLRAGFQREYRKAGQTPEDTQTQVWEHGFRMRTVSDKDELRDHLDFIHYDPVRHGLVERAGHYRWSSLAKRMTEGHYPHDWAVLAPPAGVARVLKPLPMVE